MYKSILVVVVLLITIGDMYAASRGRGRQASAAPKELRSLNLTHPLQVSFAMGELRNNLVTELEIGLAGGKLGLGIGTFDNQALMSLKAIGMYTWKSPFNDDFDDFESDLIDQEPFPIDRWYYGGEFVLSNQGYRVAIAAYRLYDPQLGEIEETLYGASLGLGW